jgi:hypothetical protein
MPAFGTIVDQSSNSDIAGHCNCVKHTMNYGIPLLVTGGGGYTKSNVARCWANETAALVNQRIPHKLPSTAYDEYFFVKDGDPTLRLRCLGEKLCENLNRQDEIDNILEKVMNNLDAIRTKPTPRAKVWYFLVSSGFNPSSTRLLSLPALNAQGMPLYQGQGLGCTAMRTCSCKCHPVRSPCAKHMLQTWATLGKLLPRCAVDAITRNAGQVLASPRAGQPHSTKAGRSDAAAQVLRRRRRARPVFMTLVGDHRVSKGQGRTIAGSLL